MSQFSSFFNRIPKSRKSKKTARPCPNFLWDAVFSTKTYTTQEFLEFFQHPTEKKGRCVPKCCEGGGGDSFRALPKKQKNGDNFALSHKKRKKVKGFQYRPTPIRLLPVQNGLFEFGAKNRPKVTVFYMKTIR